MASGKVRSEGIPAVVTTVSEFEDLVYKAGYKPTICMFYEGSSADTPIRQVLGLPTGADKALVCRVTETLVLIRVIYLYDKYFVRYSLSTHAPLSTRRFMRAHTQSSFYQIKTFSAKYKITTAKAKRDLTLSDFEIDTYYSDFRVIGMQRFTSGSNHNMITYIRGDFSQADITAGTATVMTVKNDGTVNSSDVTATIVLVYARINYTW